MRLKSFGCSFVFGSDLTDPRDPGWASKVSWPALLAKELGRDYYCYAWPGIGNLQIAHRILEQAEYACNDLFVVGWTWIDRFDYVDSATDNWTTLRPSNTAQLTQFYYKNLHSQYYDKFLSLMAISSAIHALKEKQIPYVMTYMDQTMFENTWHCDSVILKLQQDIKPNMFLFEDQTFLNWSNSKGFAVSDTLHPLEQAHQSAANWIYTNLDTILHKA